ncbi:MAG: class I SAM-dependent methyltransferase [Candidatus Bathyarchaeia archaeon]|jgi:SAM-dependent methyltransferase
MNQNENTRETVLKASRAYYTHLAYYEDLLAQRQRRTAETTKRQLDFLESTCRTHATHPVKDVLDVACGNGRHIVGLAHRGYRCTGLDYTPERVEIAKARAKREGVSLKLLKGDATRLEYQNEFDAGLALYILFLLPNDDDVVNSLRQIHRALRSGGILVCNIYNSLYAGKGWFSELIRKGLHVEESHARGVRITTICRRHDFDPIHCAAWDQETSIIEAPDGTHVFRDRERERLFTYWDIVHYLQATGFKEINCYPDWKIKPPRKPEAKELIFVSRKD